MTDDTRVGLLIQNETNRRLLDDWLSQRYGVVVGEPAVEDEGVDLYVFDPPSFRRYRDRLVERKRTVAPRILPFLLVRSESDRALDDRVWEHVDEIIETPIGQRELAQRIEVLVRMRALSTDLARRTEQLEVLNRILRHDVENDMQVVLGMGRALESHVDPEKERYLERLLESADHVVELTGTLRELMDAILNEKQEPESVGLGGLLEREIEDVDAAFGAAVVRADGDLPRVAVLADDMLESVFHNLLTNAVVHNDEDEPVVEVSVAEADDHVVVSVADNGPGVRDDRKEEIFGKGEKGLDSSGTGIGLYLVHTLVDQYGGEVWVEDNDPEGSVFRVKLRKAA